MLVRNIFVSFALMMSLSVAAVEIIQSPNDERDYRYLELKNGLQAVLISDPQTDKSAASLDVFVGSSSDPKEWQGLAHFLEHMLFLGTEKYPTAGEYQAFISKHGGQHNAYTASDHTNYFFDIDSRQLEPALDRFSQFFIAPLFTPQYVEREKHAVHSEYTAKLKDDYRRIYAVRSATMNPDSPYARFSVGNLETLADKPGKNIREALLDFYAGHYSANLMRLVVLGKEPLDVLENWVREDFAEVPNHNSKRLIADSPSFRPDELPQRVELVPVKELRALNYTFVLPAIEQLYLSKPAHYIGHLLGHEGKGSLLSLLKAEGWVENLSAGPEFSNATESLFGVNISLTREGLKHTDEITQMLFQAIRLIQKEAVKPWIYQEMQVMADLEFRFQEKGDATHTVSALSRNLQYYAPEDILRGDQIMQEYRPQLLQQFLDALRPEQLNITLIAPELADLTDSIEPYYQVPFRKRSIGVDEWQQWLQAPVDERLRLPSVNPFIPKELTLISADATPDKPVRILDEPGLSVWHQLDTSFEVPKASLYFSVRSPVANDSAQHAVLTQLLVENLKEQLNELSYPARLAGLNYTLYPHIRGFSVRIGGYDEKQSLLLESILTAIDKPKWKQEQFSIIKQRLERELANDKLKRPYQQAYSTINELLLSPQWSAEAQLKALKPLQLKQLKDFSAELLSSLEVAVLSHGNVSREETLTMAATLREHLLDGAQPLSVPRASVVRLDSKLMPAKKLDIQHPDSVVTLYFQAEDAHADTIARVALLEQVISAPFYTQLRTEQQLGYIVHAGSIAMLEVPGLAFIVQSPVASASAVVERVDAFISAFATEELNALTPQALEVHKQGLITSLLEEDKNLSQRTGRYWEDLDRQNHEFDYRQQIAAALNHIDLNALRDFYQSMLLQQARKLLVYAPGSSNAAEALPESTFMIDSVQQFKLNHSLMAQNEWPPVSESTADPSRQGAMP